MTPLFLFAQQNSHHVLDWVEQQQKEASHATKPQIALSCLYFIGQAVEKGMTTTLTLLDSPRVRYLTGAMMYFAQGIPQGLLGIAIPAWLVSQGVSAADIGSYLAVIILPWVFKLLSGPLMDRFGFQPMGRRRPWVLAAQLGL